jgi:hypothetical protein
MYYFPASPDCCAPHKSIDFRTQSLLPWDPLGVQDKTETVLEFVDDRDNMLWRFPNVTPLRDLLAPLHYQVANARDFLNDILSEE